MTCEEAGRLGGIVRSERKSAASRRNINKARETRLKNLETSTKMSESERFPSFLRPKEPEIAAQEGKS
jgi:hypothetical protein